MDAGFFGARRLSRDTGFRGEDVIDDAVDKSMDLEAETSKASFSTRSVPEGGPPRPGTAISEPLTDFAAQAFSSREKTGAP